jgi:putative effector of murein hydrolase
MPLVRFEMHNAKLLIESRNDMLSAPYFIAVLILIPFFVAQKFLGRIQSVSMINLLPALIISIILLLFSRQSNYFEDNLFHNFKIVS